MTWQDGSEVIRVTFKSHEPEDAKKIVDAVQKAFMTEVVQKDVQEKQVFRGRSRKRCRRCGRSSLSRSATGRWPRPSRSRSGRDPAAPPVAIVPVGGVPPKDRLAPVPSRPRLRRSRRGPARCRRSRRSAAGRSRPWPTGDPARPRGWERLIQEPARDRHQRDGLAHAGGRSGCRSRSTRGSGGSNSCRPSSTRSRTRRSRRLTLDMVERDQDVIVQILKTKQAWRDYEFRLNAAGDPNAPGVVELKKAYEAHEAKLVTGSQGEGRHLRAGPPRSARRRRSRSRWRTLIGIAPAPAGTVRHGQGAAGEGREATARPAAAARSAAGGRMRQRVRSTTRTPA